MNNNTYFRRGEKTLLAKAANMSPNYVSDVFARRRQISLEAAKTLAEIGADLLGPDRAVPWTAIINNKYTRHPAFTGEPARFKFVRHFKNN